MFDMCSPIEGDDGTARDWLRRQRTCRARVASQLAQHDGVARFAAHRAPREIEVERGRVERGGERRDHAKKKRDGA